MAEKLLNDMLKATEAFNKLKKMNDGLNGQAGQINEIARIMGFADYQNEQLSRGAGFLLDAI